MSNNSERKRVSLETAARTLSRFSPPELIYPETQQIADGNFGSCDLEDHEKERLQKGAIEYRDKLQEIKYQLAHRALLCIAIDQSSRRESGLYVDSSDIRFGNKPKSSEPYDLSVTNWEFSPDGNLSRGRRVQPSATPEFGAWDIRYVKDASISNAIRQDSGQYNLETLAIDDITEHNIILSYSTTLHEGSRPFHEAFTNAPGENL